MDCSRGGGVSGLTCASVTGNVTSSPPQKRPIAGSRSGAIALDKRASRLVTEIGADPSAGADRTVNGVTGTTLERPDVPQTESDLA